MKMRMNDFDCVKMKQELQEKMRAEYEATQDQYTSYIDFIHKKADHSELMQILKNKLHNNSERAA